MQTSQTLRFAGDLLFEKVEIRSLNGQSANIIQQIIGIDIYEDLFSPFMSLSIVLKESVDYLNLFPFIGEEYIDLKLTTPLTDSSIEGKFYIYKIVDREQSHDREVVYTIKAISEEFLVDCNRKLSKSYSGNIGEMASRILTVDGFITKKNCYIEKTINNTAFTAAFWAPSKCLNFLTTTAVNQAQSPSYLFYENRDGFNFRSIDELLKQTTYHSFVSDNYIRSTVNEQSLSTTKDPQEEYKRIQKLSIPIVTDYMEDIQTGRLKSRMVTHDIVTKMYSTKDYSVKKDTLQATLLNPYPGYSKYASANSAATMFVLPKYYGNFSTYGDVTNAGVIQRRMSFFQNIQKFKINIEVIGRTDYTVGRVVDLTIPRISQITKTDTDPRDPLLSGRYLIAAVRHSITRDMHSCSLEVIKNSVLTNFEKD